MDDPKNIIDDPPEYLRSGRLSKLVYFVIMGLIALAVFYLVRP